MKQIKRYSRRTYTVLKNSILENNSKVLQSWPVSILEAKANQRYGRRAAGHGAARGGAPRGRAVGPWPRSQVRGPGPQRAARGAVLRGSLTYQPSSTYYEFDKDLRACLVNSSNKSSRSRFLGIFPTNNRWLLKETVTPIFFPFRIS